MMLVTCAVVILRYGLDIGSIAAQEVITYFHAALFMTGASYTLLHDGHVRVDIFYSKLNPTGKAWVNAVGSILFLLPFCIFIAGISYQFVLGSWAVREISSEPGGIPAVFVLKSLIFVMAASLILQAFAEVLRNTLILIGGQPSQQPSRKEEFI